MHFYSKKHFQSVPRWDCTVMLGVFTSMLFAPPLVNASDHRNQDVTTEKSGRSLEQLTKDNNAAAAYIAQAGLTQKSMGIQSQGNGGLSAGESALINLQEQFRALRTVRPQGASSVIETLINFSDGSKQKTKTIYDRSTDKIQSMTSELFSAQGTLLANSSSVFAEQRDGSLQVTTTLIQGTSITKTVAVRKTDGSVTITGQTKEGSSFYPRTTDFRTTIDANGNLNRTFTTRDTATNSTITGVQVNNVTTSRTTSSTGNTTTTVSTVLPDGTTKTETVYQHFLGADTYSETRETVVTKNAGISANLSPFEPALFFGKTTTLSTVRETTLVPPKWVKDHIQQNVALLAGGNAVSLAMTPSPGYTAKGAFAGEMIALDGKKISFTGEIVSGSIGLGSVSYSLTFSDGRKVDVKKVRDNGTSTMTYPDGSKQKTKTIYDRSTDKIQSMTSELFSAQGTLLANSSSVFAEQRDGSLQVTTTLIQGTSVTKTVVIRKTDGSVIITGQTKEGSSFYPRTTDFRTTIDSKGNLNRTFTTRDTATNSTITGVQVNNVTTSRTTSSTGNTTTTVSTVLPDGTTKTETVYQHFLGADTYSETRETVVTKNAGISANLSPFEPALFFGKTTTLSTVRETTLVPPRWVKDHIQQNVGLLAGGNAVSLAMTPSPGYTAKGAFAGEMITLDGKKISFTGEIVSGSIGLGSVSYSLTFSDGRKVDVKKVRDNGTSTMTYPDGSKQKTKTIYDRSTDKIQSMTSELFSAQGALLANSSSIFAEQKDGSLQVTTTLIQGTSITKTVAVRKTDGSVTITGQTKEGSSFYPRTTDFRTTIDSKGNLNRTFTTRDTATNSTITGVQVNNVTTSRTTSSTGNTTTTVSTDLPDGTTRTETIYQRYIGNGKYYEIRQITMSKRIGISVNLSPFEPALFFGRVEPMSGIKYQALSLMVSVSKFLAGIFSGGSN